MADGSLFGCVHGPIVIDLFAGGGGASEGIRQALGAAPVVAINHCRHAIEMHSANHPDTEHYLESVFDVAPLKAARGRRIDLLWASPSCTHFSRARGGTPVSEQLRSHGWVVVDWARDVRPRVICCENVEEWQTWGPIDADGQPIKARAGETWREFLAALRGLGYAVEYRVLRAADYGAPTTRKRLFLIARCDGEPIVWPEPTHGPGRASPWRTAAECIDWSIPMLSIFATREEAKVWAKAVGADGVPQRPLADATQRRIAEGIRRFVLTSSKPFLLRLTHGGRLEPIDEPARTITAAHRGESALVSPFLSPVKTWGGGGNSPSLLDTPMRTITSSKRGEHAIVTPILAKLYGTSAAASCTAPLPTVTGQGGHLALVAPCLIQTGYGERTGQAPRVLDLGKPLGTIVNGGKHALVAAFLSQHNGGKDHPLAAVGRSLFEPHRAIVGKANAALTSVDLCEEPPEENPVLPFMRKFFPDLADITVTIDGVEYTVCDIGMRMLQPHELARAQGFDDSYVLTGTKDEQVARLGNSVCPPVARAIVAANFNPPMRLTA